MSRSSPWRGRRPCSSTNRWISSNPAMIRSSRGVYFVVFFGFASTPSSANSAASLSVNLLLAIARLGLHSLHESYSLGHAFLPCVGRRKRRDTAVVVLEFYGPYQELASLLYGKLD